MIVPDSQSHAAASYSVGPFRFELAPSGSKSSQRLSIENTGDEPLALSVDVSRVRIDSDGNLSMTPTTGDFLIFPPQMSLPPGKLQVVQVRYVGNPRIQHARLYAVIVEQVPVSFIDSGQVKLKLATRYVTAALVRPKGAEPDIVVQNIDKTNADAARVVLENRGTGAARLSQLSWTLITADGDTLAIESDDVDYGESAYFLPASERVVVLKSKALNGRAIAEVRLKMDR